MKEFFTKTFGELTAEKPLEIQIFGDTQLTPNQLFGVWSVINYRFENLLPTVTYTDKKPFELSKAFWNTCEYQTIANAIVRRLYEMGVRRR